MKIRIFIILLFLQLTHGFKKNFLVENINVQDLIKEIGHPKECLCINEYRLMIYPYSSRKNIIKEVLSMPYQVFIFKKNTLIFHGLFFNHFSSFKLPLFRLENAFLIPRSSDGITDVPQATVLIRAKKKYIDKMFCNGFLPLSFEDLKDKFMKSSVFVNKKENLKTKLKNTILDLKKNSESPLKKLFLNNREEENKGVFFLEINSFVLKTKEDDLENQQPSILYSVKNGNEIFAIKKQKIKEKNLKEKLLDIYNNFQQSGVKNSIPNEIIKYSTVVPISLSQKESLLEKNIIIFYIMEPHSPENCNGQSLFLVCITEGPLNKIENMFLYEDCCK